MAAAAFPKLGSLPAPPSTETSKMICGFCSHTAANLETKARSLQNKINRFVKNRRHVPVGLYIDAHAAHAEALRIRKDATTHTTRDDNRHTVCPRLLANVCEECHHTGHTRTRCPKLGITCEYCGELGHLQFECPKELADQKAKGDTLVIHGISPTVMKYLKDALAGIALYPTQTKPGLWVVDNCITTYDHVDLDGDVWEVIETTDHTLDEQQQLEEVVCDGHLD